MVLVSPEVLDSGVNMLITMVLRFQRGLKLGNRGIKMNPAFALRNHNSLTGDARCHKPVLNSLSSLSSRSKKLNNLIWGVVLAVVL